MTVMTHVKALQAGHSSQGTSEPITPGLDFVASWSARIVQERSSPPPLIPLSPITAEDSLDSIVVQVGSPTSELYTPDRTGPV